MYICLNAYCQVDFLCKTPSFILVDWKMTTATRQEVLGLYRRIFRLARKWQAASGQMEDTVKEKQYILNEARTLFQKNKNVSRPQLSTARRGAISCGVCAFLFRPTVERMEQHRGTECGAGRARAQPGWLAQPGFLSSLVSGLSPAGKWLSVLRRPHAPGDLSQANESFQGRISSLHTVPVAGHSHRRCAVKSFSIHKLFRASKYKPIQSKANRIKTQGPLHSLAVSSGPFG